MGGVKSLLSGGSEDDPTHYNVHGIHYWPGKTNHYGDWETMIHDAQKDKKKRKEYYGIGMSRRISKLEYGDSSYDVSTAFSKSNNTNGVDDIIKSAIECQQYNSAQQISESAPCIANSTPLTNIYTSNAETSPTDEFLNSNLSLRYNDTHSNSSKSSASSLINANLIKNPSTNSQLYNTCTADLHNKNSLMTHKANSENLTVSTTDVNNCNTEQLTAQNIPHSYNRVDYQSHKTHPDSRSTGTDELNYGFYANNCDNNKNCRNDSDIRSSAIDHAVIKHQPVSININRHDSSNCVISRKGSGQCNSLIKDDFKGRDYHKDGIALTETKIEVVVESDENESVCQSDIIVNISSSANVLNESYTCHSLSNCSSDNNGKEKRVFLYNDNDWLHFTYALENIAFSGGGVKGFSYIGAIKALEDAGVMPHIKRYVGASSGAMFASALAVGYTAQEISSCLFIDFTEVFNDQSCACIVCIPKLYSDYGVHPAKKFMHWFGLVIGIKTGNPDMTFKQCYDWLGKELCIAVCNLSRMGMEYCHHTTTPDLPIREAVRMSMAVPLVYEPAKREIDGQINYYIDGSTGDHFPVHCYDGPTVGYNLMENVNTKTIGFFVLSERDSEHVMWKNAFGKEIPNKPTYMPDTKLARGQLMDEIKRRKKSERDFDQKSFMKQLEQFSRVSLQHLGMKHYDTHNKDMVDTSNLLAFLGTNMELMINCQVVRKMKPEDEDRTIPINVGYMQTHSYELEPADREFMIKQGYSSTKTFLQQYGTKHNNNNQHK